VKVAVRDDLAGVDEHERIVGGGVELDRNRLLDVSNQVATSAVNLRRAAKGVRVLDATAPAVRVHDRRAFEQVEDVLGGRGLPAERPQRLHLGPEALTGALKRLDRQGARDVGGDRQPPRAGRTQRPERGHELRPVDERETLFGPQPQRFEPDAAQCLVAGQPLAFNPRLTLADQGESEMSERRKIAAGAYRPATRHLREDTAVEALDEELGHFDPRSRTADGKSVSTK
jgi:hypothetical protein